MAILIFTGIYTSLVACANRTEHTFEQPKVIPDVETIRSAINDIIPIGTGEDPIEYKKRDPLAIPETLDELPDPNAVTNNTTKTQGDEEKPNTDSIVLSTDPETTTESSSDTSNPLTDQKCDESDPNNRCSLIEPPIEYSIPPDNPAEESGEESS